VWDHFHLVQQFNEALNEALNEERKVEWDKRKNKESNDDLLSGKYRNIYLTKSKNRYRWSL
jgi:hypothetical protein